MNICDLCSYSTSVKCNLKRHRASKHKNCEGVVATEPILKTRKSTRKYESKYTLLFNLINDLKNEIIKLKNVVNSLKPVSVKCVPVVKVTDLSVNTVQITCEYLTETFAGAPNIETIIAEIGIGNGDYFEPIDRIEDEHELITTLNLSYKGQQLIFDNGDPFSWTTAYFIHLESRRSEYLYSALFSWTKRSSTNLSSSSNVLRMAASSIVLGAPRSSCLATVLTSWHCLKNIAHPM